MQDGVVDTAARHTAHGDHLRQAQEYEFRIWSAPSIDWSAWRQAALSIGAVHGVSLAVSH